MRLDGHARVAVWERWSCLGRFGRQGDRRSRCVPVCRDGLIPSMTMAAAGLAFFLDVADFAAGRYLAVPADHAATGERIETEKPNQTHTALYQRTRRNPFAPPHQDEQTLYRARATDGLVIIVSLGGSARQTHPNSPVLPERAVSLPALGFLSPVPWITNRRGIMRLP